MAVRAALGSLLAAGSVAAVIELGRDKYEIDSAHSMIGFSVDFMGLSKVEGRFARYAGTVIYDDADITRSSVTLVILTDGINTGSAFRDNHLKTAEFFDVPKFPNITFQSQKVVKQGDGFVLIGPLTMPVLRAKWPSPASSLMRAPHPTCGETRAWASKAA